MIHGEQSLGSRLREAFTLKKLLYTESKIKDAAQDFKKSTFCLIANCFEGLISSQRNKLRNIFDPIKSQKTLSTKKLKGQKNR